MADRRKLAAGNWKMNGTEEALSEIAALGRDHGDAACEVVICPPATLLSRMSKSAEGTNIQVGGQDCHEKASGAHTGDVSAAMLRDAGAGWAIVGHSERRADHGESDSDVRAKAEAAWSEGLIAIVCVGESLEEREAGRTLDVIGAQLDGSLPEGSTGETLVIAYEPIWAIGTGKVPSVEEIGEVHGAIRARLVDRFGDTGNAVRLLYGGSVKPDNAAEIFAVEDVDGALVGGASLKASDFGAIIKALDAS